LNCPTSPNRKPAPLLAFQAARLFRWADFRPIIIGHLLQRLKVTAMTKVKQAWISTATLAAQLDYEPASLRTAIWRHGHFNGITPIRLPNGRLRWPADSAARITGQAATPAAAA
jgi:hypothetical protein